MRGRGAEWAYATALALAWTTPLITVVSRGGATVTLGLTAVALLAGAALNGPKGRAALWHTFRAGARHPLAVALAALLAWMAASLAWSANPGRGLEYTGHMAGTLAFAALALAGAASRPAPLPRHGRAGTVAWAWAATGLFALAAVLIVLDIQTGGDVRALVGASRGPSRTNRATLALVLFAPLLLALLAPRLPLAATAAWVAVLGVTVALSASESAKVGAVLGLAAWLVARWRPRLAHGALLAVLLACLLLVPGFAAFAERGAPDWMDAVLPYATFGIRVDLWAQFAALALERPLIGYGMEAANAAETLEAARGLAADKLELLGFVHPHNFALQVWFELGLIGVALVAVAAIALVRLIARLPAALAASAVASASVAWFFAMVGPGAWQAWWWCLLALLAVLYVQAARTAPNEAENR